MECKTTIEESIDKIDMFQVRFGEVEKFGWWDLEQIQNDSITQFIYKRFQEGLSICIVQLTLSTLDHQ